MSTAPRPGSGCPNHLATGPCESGQLPREHGCSGRACKYDQVSGPELRLFHLSFERGYALDILLAVEEQAQQRAEEVLDALARNRLDNIALELLGAKIR